MSKKLFQRNLGRTDRIIRLIIGVLALGAWYYGAIAGTIAVIVGIGAIMLIGTSAVASCPLNSVADINTMSQEEREELDAKGISYKKNDEAMGQEKKIILGKILGILFILSAIPKAIGLQMAVDNFNKWLLGRLDPKK